MHWKEQSNCKRFSEISPPHRIAHSCEFSIEFQVGLKIQQYYLENSRITQDLFEDTVLYLKSL